MSLRPFLVSVLTERLSCQHVFMQGSTNGTLAGIQLFHHSLDLLAQTSLVEIQSKHILAAVERLQAAPVLIGLDGSKLVRSSFSPFR